MDEQEIARQKELASKATPRPWKAGFTHEIRREGTRHEIHEYEVLAFGHSCLAENIDKTFAQVGADMAYLEAAVNTHEALLDAIAQQQAEIGRLTTRAEAAEQKLRELQERTRWIPVSERLPEEDQDVLFYGGENKQIRKGKHANRWITHWQPLPVPPESENE